MALTWKYDVAIPALIGIGIVADDAPESEITDELRILWQKNNDLIWMTMVIGVNKITHKNWMEVYARVRLWDQLKGINEGRFTPRDIYNRIGLHTNADSLTRNQFIKKITDSAMKDYLYQADKYPEGTEETK